MNFRADHDRAPPRLAKPIYLDHHSTTPVDGRVVEIMVKAMTEQFGNPNNRGHLFGQTAAAVVAEAREAIGALVNADADEVIFVRSVSVALEKLLSELLVDWKGARPVRVAVSTVEHSAVLEAMKRHEDRGRLEILWVSVNAFGHLEKDDLERALENCDLLCVMAANNEVGTIYPVEYLARRAAQVGIPVLVDATQAAGYIPIDVRGWGITYLLMSAHKMYGPKGIAALIANATATEGLRNLENDEGTPNVPAIAGFGEASRLRRIEMEADGLRMAEQRDRLEAMLAARIPGLVVNGDRGQRMPNNLHVSIPGVPNDAIVARLSGSVALSTGAACRWGTDLPSHVLLAMNLPADIVEGALRFGLGRETTDDDIDLAVELIAAAAEETRLAMGGR